MGSTTLRRRLWKTPMRDLIRGRITGRLDIDKLLEDAGLTGPAASKVRNVVKRTRLWRLEKVDVAQELIAHFLDGQEAGTPMDDLLGSFGDERQTAKLIRRAKKRQRPYAWHAFAWARLGFAVIIGVYCLAALYLLTGSPDIKTNYVALLNRQATEVPADDAAWPIYREALMQLKLNEIVDWDTPIPYYSGLPEEEQSEYVQELKPPYNYSRWDRLKNSLHPSDPGWPETERYLQDNADTLAMIRKGASRPGLGLTVGFMDDFAQADLAAMGMEPAADQTTETSHSFRDPDRALIGVLLPHLGPMRYMAQLLAADAARATNLSDGVTAYDDVVAILGIADQADEQPLLINGMVRLAIQRMAYQTIQDVLASRPDLWSEEQLRNLAHHLAAIETPYADWYNGERLWFYDYLQRTYTDDGHGDGWVTNEGMRNFGQYSNGSSPDDVVSVAGLPAAAILVAPRAEMRNKYDQLMDRAVAEAGRPLWQPDQAQTFDQALEAIVSDYTSRLRYLPIAIFMPAFSAASQTIQYEAGCREGAIIGIAMTLYHRKTNKWPEKMDDLTPVYLPTVPLDRLTGEPVRYVVNEHGPVVYSIGVDGDDDAGRPPVNPKTGETENVSASVGRFIGEVRTEPEYDGDWVLWPVPEEKR